MRGMQYIYHLILTKPKAGNMSVPTARKSISHYSYHLTSAIGGGFSSQVYNGLDEKTKLPVAIKVLPKLPHRAAEQAELAATEIRVLELLKGRQNVLELKQALQTKNSVYIVTELCSRGTVRDLLASKRRLPEATAVALLRQLINGYLSIHGQGLVHRDIKPDNLFLTATHELRIGDFGFAIRAEECGEASTQNLGSPLFMAPQALTNNEYGFKSDIWAMGVTFYEMLAGRVPWRSKTEKELVRELESFKIEAILPKGISASSQRFLRRTLVNDLSERMGPEELFGFAFELSSENSSVNRQNPNLKKRSSLEVMLESQFSRERPQKQSCPAFAQQETTQPAPKEEESESTEENSKPNLENIAEIDGDAQTPIKVGSQRLINSLTKDQPEVAEKAKTKINRTYSQIKGKEQIPEPTPEDQPPIYRNKSSTAPKATLPAKLQKEILLQIQSQVNYFRFTYKLFKRTNETLKTSDDHIRKLKQSLLFLTHAKIEEIRTLKHLGLGAEVEGLFQETAEFAKVLEVLRQYEQRYLLEEGRTGVQAASGGEKEFVEQLAYTLRVLYQNIVKIEGVEEEFQRKKNLVFIVEDLLELSHLYNIQRARDWAIFHRQSNVLKALVRTPPEGDLHAYWDRVRQSLKKSIKI